MRSRKEFDPSTLIHTDDDEGELEHRRKVLADRAAVRQERDDEHHRLLWEGEKRAG